MVERLRGGKLPYLRCARQLGGAISAAYKAAMMNSVARAENTTTHAHEDVSPNLADRTKGVKASTKSWPSLPWTDIIACCIFALNPESETVRGRRAGQHTSVSNSEGMQRPTCATNVLLHSDTPPTRYESKNATVRRQQRRCCIRQSGASLDTMVNGPFRKESAPSTVASKVSTRSRGAARKEYLLEQC